jgi:hypothetical protein
MTHRHSEEVLMLPNGKLRAWIEECGGDGVRAAFIVVSALDQIENISNGRPPATLVWPSSDAARKWVEDEGKAFGFPVEWLDETH